MKGECSCWCEYPNEAHRMGNGKWKCVDDYKCVRSLKKPNERRRGYKTKCVKKHKPRQAKAKKDLLIGTSQLAVHIRVGQIWDIRTVPFDEYENYRISRDCISLEISAYEFGLHFEELTEDKTKDGDYLD